MSREGKFWIKVVTALLLLLVYLWWEVFSLTGILWWDFNIPAEKRKPPYTNEEFRSPYVPVEYDQPGVDP